MKRPFCVIPLIIVFCVLLIASKPMQAEKWTTGQKEIVQLLEKHAEATKRGNVDEIMKDFHPKFSGWDLAQTPPMFDKGPYDRAFCRFSFEEYFKLYKLISFEIEPLEIVVEGNLAVAHLDYKETIEDSKGTVTTASGRLSAGLMKQDGKWTFLSWAWIGIE